MVPGLLLNIQTIIQKVNTMKSINQQSRFKLSGGIKIAFLLLLSLPIFSFQPGEYYKAKRRTITKKSFSISQPFKNIRFDGNIEIVLTNAPAGTLIVEGKEKEINKISPIIADGQVIINVQRKNYFSEMKVYLSALNLESIIVNGDAGISSSEVIDVTKLHFSLNGHSSIKIKVTGDINLITPYEYDLYRGSLMLLN